MKVTGEEDNVEAWIDNPGPSTAFWMQDLPVLLMGTVFGVLKEVWMEVWPSLRIPNNSIVMTQEISNLMQKHNGTTSIDQNITYNLFPKDDQDAYKESFLCSYRKTLFLDMREQMSKKAQVAIEGNLPTRKNLIEE